MRTFIEFFVRNRLFGDLLILFVIIAGVTSAFLIRREAFPNVSFDIISVTTIFPGASPEEVEKLITNPLEQDLQEVDGIKKMQSISTEGRSVLVIFLDPDQTTEAEGKADIQDVVDLFDPPDEAEDPIVTALQTKQQPIIEVAVAGDLPELELRKIAREIEKELEKLPGVAKVVQTGERDLEIRVEADPKKLTQYAISLDELVQALKLQNRSIPAGTIEPLEGFSDEEFIVRTIGEFKSLKDVGDTVIRANELGQPIMVKDVANISYGLEKSDVITRTNGLPSLSLTVLKKEKADAIRVVDAVRSRMAELNAKYKDKVETNFINDLSQFIRRRLSVLSGNLVIGLALILLCLSVFLPFRIAAIVSVGIVVSFFGTIMILYAYGYSVNLISLIGLIIVSGMLVDDAIVVSDNTFRHLQGSKNKIEAAIRGAVEIWPAVTASVLTTVIAFVPMLFMSGIFGKFVKEIPLGVILALGISLFEAILIIPQHVATYVNPESKSSDRLSNLTGRIQNWWDTTLVPAYGRFLEVVLKWRYAVLGGMVVFFVTSLIVAAAALKFILFPPDGIEIFFVRVQAPTGSSLQQTSELIRPLEKLIQQLPENELQDFVTTVGLVQQDPHDPNTQRGSEYAQIAVFLTPEEQRERTAAEIIADIRERAGIPPGLVRVTYDRVNPGPPTGKPVSLSVRGPNYPEILAAVEDLKNLIRELPGTSDISDSYVEGKKELQVIINKAEAAAAGLSVTQVGMTVRAAFDGLIATTIQELDEEVNVRVSYPPEAKVSRQNLQNITIPNSRGNLIPLSRIARIQNAQGVAVYQHENNLREVKVTAELDTDVTSSLETNARIRELLPALQEKHSQVTVAFGGEDEDTQESLASLGRAFGLAFMGIFLLLILTFKNLFQPFLVVLTIPLGIISVIWTLLFAGQPLSFMAMLGVIALGGVVVNNAIVLIDFVNLCRSEGMSHWDSIIQAAKIRLRPIFLTSTTTVCGLLPTAHGIGGTDPFVVPIALSLGYGLLFGSVMTVFFFPAAIAIVDDIAGFFSRKLKGQA